MAHCEQFDKAGNSYAGHPQRVAERVRANGGNDLAVTVAWLHDTLEDTWVDHAFLRACGFPPLVIRAVEAVTKRDGESPADYANRIAASRLATQVKRADLGDNSDRARLELLDPATRNRLIAKYVDFTALLDQAVARRQTWEFVEETLRRLVSEGWFTGYWEMRDSFEPYIRNRIDQLCNSTEEALVLLENLSRFGVVTTVPDDGSGRTPLVKGTEYSRSSRVSSLISEVTVFTDGSFVAEVLDPQWSSRQLPENLECIGDWVNIYGDALRRDEAGEVTRIGVTIDPAYWVRYLPHRANQGWGWICTELSDEALHGRQERRW